MFKDYYKILGVNRNASIDEIQKKYNLLLLKNEKELLSDVEEAHYVLTSYRLKGPYDEEYDKYIVNPSEEYFIKDIWTKNEIEKVHVRVVNLLSDKNPDDNTRIQMNLS